MQIVMTGRRTTVEESLHVYLTDRLGRLDKHDPRVERVDVEICEESNPRLAAHKVRVELTWHGRGPIVRSEASGPSTHEAVDLALGKLDGRLRKAADRRRIHHGSRTPVSLAAATARPLDADPELLTNGAAAASNGAAPHGADDDLGGDVADDGPDDVGPMVVREKEHVAAPMTLDQALFQMELVGHEFYLFVDCDHGLPSVVYRRRGYDYGVLRLRADAAIAADVGAAPTHSGSSTTAAADA